MSLNPPLKNWSGLPVWVVGASSGIGLALASRLHALGARVTVSARQAWALEAFASTHPGALAVPLDVTDAQAVARASTQVHTHHGLHLVVYCVGHYLPQRATAFNAEEMHKHMRINYDGAVHCVDAVLPHLLKQGRGHVSLISSVAGFRGLPKSLAYGPSKAALTHFAEVLHLDLKDHGVGVSVVHPGFVRTPLTAQNDFQMPALIEPEAAAQAMIDQWGKGVFEVHFPKRFTHVMKALRLLPYGLYLRLASRLTPS
ncbi:MAG: SDR family NAD(P)-dependent oxidoreductase [Betaproteobacteria bacterium]|jgi:NAD(P)-dependent dehydrogenase (short-subunit alcohol dehydrogenase family)|nr:SDR family NAD(P)-dependent oxidoreductase [Betaproteobacteria bacterium]NBP44403.1 SDR family NAD(P)-dependent oxidoreductase [Betaproteobacteria bacterium]